MSWFSRLYSSATEALDHRYGWDKMPKPIAMLTLIGIRNRRESSKAVALSWVKTSTRSSRWRCEIESGSGITVHCGRSAPGAWGAAASHTEPVIEHPCASSISALAAPETALDTHLRVLLADEDQPALRRTSS